MRGVLLVDFCKAFDIVEHNLLLLKLEAYVLPIEQIIGVSLISLVDVSWSAMMARKRLWLVLTMEYHKDLKCGSFVSYILFQRCRNN